MDADTLYRMAETELEEGDRDNAISALERLVISFRDWDRITDARLLLADIYYDKNEFITSRSEYQRFLDRYVGHPESARAALGECRSLAGLTPGPQRDQGYTADAVTICRNVVIDYAGTPQSAQAAEIMDTLRLTMAEKEYLNADFYFRRKMYDSAIIYYNFVADLYAGTEFAPRALLGISLSNQAIGYKDEANEARDRLLRDYPSSEAAAEIRVPLTGDLSCSDVSVQIDCTSDPRRRP